MRGRLLPIVTILTLIIILIIPTFTEYSAYSPKSSSLSFEIIISDNDKLLEKAYEQGWIGTGTPFDPVIIANITYDLNLSNGDAGISLRNVSLYILIQNVTIRSGEYGIKCNDVSNLTIRDVILIECKYGIFIDHGKNINITKLNLTGGDHGLYLIESTSMNISGNSIFETSTGMTFENNTKDVTISDCEFLGTYCGIIISYCDDIELRSTYLGDSKNIGIQILGSYSITLDGCRFEKVNATSIKISETSFAYVINCTFLNNRGNPLHLWDSSNIFLVNCDLIDNLAPIEFDHLSGMISFIECNFQGSSDFIDAKSGRILIKDCYFESNGQGGIDIDDCKDLELTDNVFIGSGIYLYRNLEVSDFKITGNQVNGEDLLFFHLIGNSN